MWPLWYYFALAAGCLFLASFLTYCAINWDDPPDWWPHCLQPNWNHVPPKKKKTDLLQDSHCVNGWDTVDDAQL